MTVRSRLALGLVLLLACAVRWRLLDVPLERDEGEYAYAGQLILQGVPPYRLAYNMKLPGTYAAYAALMAVFGQTPRGIHLGLLVVNLATALLVFRLARRLFEERTAAVAAAAFAIFSLSQGVYGVFAHATHFVILPAVAGCLLLLRASDRESAPALFGAGLLFGAAFIMKQHGVFFVLFALVWLLGEEAGRRRARADKDAALVIRLAPGAARAGWLLLGAVLPFGLACALLAAAGVFRDFWFWTFDYAGTYVAQVPPALGLSILAQRLPTVALPTLPLWVLAGIGLLAPLWHGPARDRWRFTTLFALFSFLSICPGFYFREHYFVLLLPAASLLVGVAVGATGRALPSAVFLAALLYPVLREREFFLAMTPQEASRSTYGPNPFPEAAEIARQIRADTVPGDRVAVLGSEPEIFFYAHRRSATGYIYMYGLMEWQPYAHGMQQAAIGQIESSAPKYVVFVDVPQSWLAGPTPTRRFSPGREPTLPTTIGWPRWPTSCPASRRDMSGARRRSPTGRARRMSSTCSGAGRDRGGGVPPWGQMNFSLRAAKRLMRRRSHPCRKREMLVWP